MRTAAIYLVVDANWERARVASEAFARQERRRRDRERLSSLLALTACLAAIGGFVVGLIIGGLI